MGRGISLAAALMLAACGSTPSPPAASAESIEQAVNNAERELAVAKAGGSKETPAGLFGA